MNIYSSYRLLQPFKNKRPLRPNVQAPKMIQLIDKCTNREGSCRQQVGILPARLLKFLLILSVEAGKTPGLHGM